MQQEELNHIIRGCQRKNRASQERLYQRFSPVIFGLCLRYGRSREEAEDLFQEGFVLAFEKIGQYAFNGSFEGWLKRLFINKFLEHFRKEKMLFTASTPEMLELQLPPTEFADVLTEQELLELVNGLSPQYRLVFNLYVIEGFQHHEIAEQLNISVGTSKSNLARARLLLRQRILELYPEESNKRHGKAT